MDLLLAWAQIDGHLGTECLQNWELDFPALQKNHRLIERWFGSSTGIVSSFGRIAPLFSVACEFFINSPSKRIGAEALLPLSMGLVPLALCPSV